MPGISPIKLLSPVNKGSSQSWQSYWTHQSECYELWDLSKASGGSCVGLKRGDILSYTGSIGNAHYTLPNTPTYKTKDTDYAWFKTDGSVSDMTSARLVGYDLQATPVKYDNASPNLERWIMILNSMPTGSQLNKLFQAFHLPIEWHNDTNAYGYIKSNRTGQNLWTPESVYADESSALFTRMTAVSETPPDARRVILDTAIKADKANIGFTNKYDALWLTAAHGANSSLLNIIKNASNISLVNTPDFTIDRGYIGNGSDEALCCNYTPSTDHIKYIQDTFSFGLYIRTNSDQGGRDMSSETSSLHGLFFLSKVEGDIYYCIDSIYDHFANSNGSGMYILTSKFDGPTRTLRVYRNALLIKEVPLASLTVALSTAILHLMCSNIVGVLSNFSTRQYGLAFIGGYMDQTEITAFQTTWVDGYLNSIGAKV